MKKIFILITALFFTGCIRESYMKPGTIQSQYASGFYVELLMLPDELKGIKLPRGTKLYKFTRENRHLLVKKYYTAKKPHNEIPKENMWNVKKNNDFKKHNFDIGNLAKVPIKECYKNEFCKLYPVSYDETFYIKRDNIYQSDKDVTWLDKLDESK
ncbi:MAG: Unknown protein [uncultured Campylobacterales bacterium]|uniref:Lipoprotein n=1 Tax=uncultured Campylobacterales bacterium TaxID=352960 RepID=A0A6S6STP4_9BACT|nr:MAG: Unknown protein [uncultured Campylobacterales bacterium]